MYCNDCVDSGDGPISSGCQARPVNDSHRSCWFRKESDKEVELLGRVIRPPRARRSRRGDVPPRVPDRRSRRCSLLEKSASRPVGGERMVMLWGRASRTDMWSVAQDQELTLLYELQDESRDAQRIDIQSGL